MEKEEFIKQAKEYGYTDEMIEEVIKLQEEAKKSGIDIPWDHSLENLPTY